MHNDRPPRSHRARSTTLVVPGRFATVTAALLAGVSVVGTSAATDQTAIGHPLLATSTAILGGSPPLNRQTIDPQALDLRTSDPQIFGPQISGPQISGPQISGPQILGPQISGLQTAGLQTADPQSFIPDAGTDTDGDEDYTTAWDDRAVGYIPRHGVLPAHASVPASTAKAPAPPTARATRSATRARQRARLVAPPAWVDPLPEARVTSCFGQRWGRLHAGVDLAAPNGTRIRAAGTGTVVAAGPAAGYGNAVLIDHGNGYLTHYGHMSVITVQLGQHVSAGDQIGNEGSTGHSTGPHLHFEVHLGFYKNPIEPTGWMHAHGVDIPGCVPLTDTATGSRPATDRTPHAPGTAKTGTAKTGTSKTGTSKTGHTQHSAHTSQNGKAPTAHDRSSVTGERASTAGGRHRARAAGAHRARMSDPTPTAGQHFRAERHRRAPLPG